MSIGRVCVLVALLAFGCAGLLAVVSRTPAEVRSGAPARDATDPSHGASFTDAQIRRHAAYRGPSYLSFGLGILLRVVFLLTLAGGAWPRLVGAVERLPGGWLVHAAVVGVAVVVLSTLVTLPLSFVRSYVIDHAWGLSTQGISGWIRDRAVGLGLGMVMAAVTSIAFFGIVRWQPSMWWLYGWASFALLTVVFVFVYPVVITPLFNKFEPLPAGPLDDRIHRLVDQTGLGIDEVLVADASRRTTAENAYVAGIGSSKRLVLYDTLVQSGDQSETALVVAHELGHRVRGHIWKNIAIAVVGLGLGFGALALLSGQGAVWSWAGAAGIGDLRAVPVLLLLSLAASFVTLPVESSISRRFEAEADIFALQLTDDPGTAVRVFRRLAFSNLGDLKPPGPVVWAIYTHPPTTERIRAALSYGKAGP